MTSDNDNDSENLSSSSWFLLRPTEVTKLLPVDYRWEFTRRHPYYLRYWEAAAQHHQSPSTDPQQLQFEELATLVLGSLGISETMAPPHPRSDADEIGISGLENAWAKGAVAPATLRTLAAMLLVALPPSARMQFGRLLAESAEYDSEDSAKMHGTISRLKGWKEPCWNDFPGAPIISINLQSPQRAIVEAVEHLTANWKKELGISQTRRRDDKLESYLNVWDRREGWHDGQYDGGRECKIHGISAELQIPVGTVINHYRSAFYYLSGHNFTRELWIQLMGPTKFAHATSGRGSLGLTLRRPLKSPRPRPVSESVLLPGRKDPDEEDFLAQARIAPSEITLKELSLDIDSLLERGFTDEQILDELEVSGDAEAQQLVADLRDRRADG